MAADACPINNWQTPQSFELYHVVVVELWRSPGPPGVKQLVVLCSRSVNTNKPVDSPLLVSMESRNQCRISRTEKQRPYRLGEHQTSNLDFAIRPIQPGCDADDPSSQCLTAACGFNSFASSRILLSASTHRLPAGRSCIQPASCCVSQSGRLCNGFYGHQYLTRRCGELDRGTAHNSGGSSSCCRKKGASQ